MPTVSKHIADEIKANNGHYANDPLVVRIVEYTNAWGGTAYGLEYEGRLGQYSESPYVINPTDYFRHPSID